MIFAPIFGYMGDRYSRKLIMTAGVFLWSLTTLAGSFMTNYWWFLLFRGLVGIGEASYSTIAPTIISDLFKGNMRSIMLALFYFAIPVGSGLGYIVGSETAKLMNSWKWALRVTPVLGIAAVLLIFFILKDPKRGESEGSHLEPTTFKEDIKDIIQNRSFMFSTAGFTCVAFVAGALAWWGPKFIEMGLNLQNGGKKVDSDSVSLTFGAVSMVSGLMGVPMGSYLAQSLRPHYSRVDAHLCGIGLIVSSPLVFCVLISAQYNTTLCYCLVFFAEFFLNLTWSIVADILLLNSYLLRCFSNSFIFGGVTIAAGVVGLSLGGFLSQKLRVKYHRVDPIICGAGLVLSAPFLLGCTYAATSNTVACYVLLFLGQVALNLNWAIVGDILLYVVLPTRRSSAEGFQLLFSHALGDAGSPYLIGVLSDAFKITLSSSSTNSTTQVKSSYNDFKALQYALFSTCFVEILGGFFFLVTAFYVVEDKRKVEKAIQAFLPSMSLERWNMLIRQKVTPAELRRIFSISQTHVNKQSQD
ncbi:hypothetical protein WA026_000588 [Henosepilachna vigintioctopunctata]|uniref:Major facilitator superfamily (MFS) profile domain-containing protein n=1 Tax=Henosepilachna vigintioctopunctata TaxID=420089 RepID=A0AAW1V7Q4_9CUCU